MKLAVVKECLENERRVAVSEETIKKFVNLGCEVFVETGAGFGVDMSDAVIESAGGKIAANRAELLSGADAVLTVRGLTAEDAGSLSPNTIVLGLFNPTQNLELVNAIMQSGARIISLEFIPRITRAQSMDVLSSQSNLAGYKAVLDALDHFKRAVPMMMTAAGTIAPAKVMVMGAGVAGLQAIATARRLGAVVSATDVRLAAKEQVESLGANFVMVEDEESLEAETSGGYAREMSDAYKEKQAALIRDVIKKQDIVITTALIPGRAAPRLVTSDMIASMKPGSVLVDLAVEQGGNVEGSKVGEVVDISGIKIVGHVNVPSRLAVDASQLFAKNRYNYLSPFIKDGSFELDKEDEIVANSTIAVGGDIVHPMLKGGE